jgi:hypothetical protein
MSKITQGAQKYTEPLRKGGTGNLPVNEGYQPEQSTLGFPSFQPRATIGAKAATDSQELASSPPTVNLFFI